MAAFCFGGSDASGKETVPGYEKFMRRHGRQTKDEKKGTSIQQNVNPNIETRGGDNNVLPEQRRSKGGSVTDTFEVNQEQNSNRASYTNADESVDLATMRRTLTEIESVLDGDRLGDNASDLARKVAQLKLEEYGSLLSQFVRLAEYAGVTISSSDGLREIFLKIKRALDALGKPFIIHQKGKPFNLRHEFSADLSENEDNQ